MPTTATEDPLFPRRFRTSCPRAVVPHPQEFFLSSLKILLKRKISIFSLFTSAVRDRGSFRSNYVRSRSIYHVVLMKLSAACIPSNTMWSAKQKRRWELQKLMLQLQIARECWACSSPALCDFTVLFFFFIIINSWRNAVYIEVSLPLINHSVLLKKSRSSRLIMKVNEEAADAVKVCSRLLFLSTETSINEELI